MDSKSSLKLTTAVISLGFISFALLATAGCNSNSSSSSEIAANQAASAPGAPAKQPAAPVNPATVGTITGMVKLAGTPPPMPIIEMDADPTCQKSHQGPVHSDEVVVGKDRSLGNVVVYLKSGVGNYSFPAPADPVTLDQKGCMYEPHVVTLMTHQAFQIVNSDPTAHTIYAMPQANRTWNESQPPGTSPIDKEFARPEIAIPVECNVHPWMKAYIFVFDNPYFARTSTDGAFTISNVPPGTYTIEAWQERYGTEDQQVTIAAKESKTVDFSFKAQ